jgi:predicted dehydrogenase
MAAGDMIGLGLIGCGGFGEFCLDAYSKLDGLRIAAVADVVRPAADAMGRRFGVAALYDPDELIRRDDVQMVHVATPPASHHGLVMSALSAGKHCLCEKPLAVTEAQGREMVAAAERAGLIVPVDFVLRYNPVTEAVKAIVGSRLLGECLSARLTNCASDAKLDAGHWFWDERISGGIFIEHGVHFFDLYRHWLGDGRVLSARCERRDGTGQEDRVTCLVRHAGGAIASHYHGFDQLLCMDRTDHRLVFEQGDVRVDGWIPLRLDVDAATDDEGAEKLAALMPGCDMETVERFDGRGEMKGRGTARRIDRRVRMRFEPEPDKSTAYAGGVRDLMADQLAYIADRSHRRRVSERNGLEALETACAAASLCERD